MNRKDPKLIVLQFNACINRQDLHGLSALMSEEHTFIDSSESVYSGKGEMIEGWLDFFDRYPDYKNHFSRMESRGNFVVIEGYSTCSYDPLDGPALWTAKVENDLVAEWRVYLDTEENRKMLNLFREDSEGGVKDDD